MKRIEVMNRASFIKHGSKMVFVCDVSGLNPEDAMKVIKHTEDVVRRMPTKSVLALAYLDNVEGSKEMGECIKYLHDKCTPHVLKGAYCDITDKILKGEIEHLLPTSGSKRKSFGSREEALSWLVSGGE